jgi:hypothetical protein
MTDITPTGPAKPTKFDINTFDFSRGWTSTNSLALFKAARAAQKQKLTSALASPPISGEQRTAANRREAALKADIIRFKRAIDKTETDFKNGTITSSQRTLLLTTHYTSLSAATAELEVLEAQTREIKRKVQGSPSRKTGTGGTIDGQQKPPQPADNKLRFNVGSVSEAYFTSRTEFLLDKANTEKLGSAVENNRPSPSLTSALELWNNGKASKGMFITWRDLSTGFQANLADKNLLGTNEKLPPHAFRFQYNPGSISMSYAGTPLVDPNFEAAGLDKFNLTGTGVTQSTIQFQLLINRMYDMKYYTREDEQSVDGEGGTNPPGTLRPNAIAADVYGKGVVLDFETQRAIYNMGTMYDLEFLLRTIMGYTMKSSLRDYSFFDDKGTADMGFLGARPVELHLGKNMRYLVFITGINVEHVIFDNRMVPLFSNVSITCSRLPDYQSTNSSQLTGEPSPIVNRGGSVGSEDYRRANRQR